MKKVTLIYAGLRIAGDKTFQCFVAGKKEYHWSNVKWVVIGEKYKADKHSDGHLTIKVRPESCGEAEVDSVLMDSWREKNALAEQHRRNKAAYSRAKNIQPELVKLLEPVRQRLRKYKTMEEHTAFEKLVLRIINS